MERQTVFKWEANAVQLTLEDIEHLCTIFDVSIDYFLNRKPETEVAAENGGEQWVSEPVSDKTVPRTKRKPWKSLVVAIVFTVLTFVPLFFSIITGVPVFSTTQGDDVVFDRSFDLASFFMSLGSAILCFVLAMVGWIRFVWLKKR